MTETQEKVTATLIFNKMQEFVEAKVPVSREAWLEVAFKLDVLRVEEAKLYNRMHQSVAQRKNLIYKQQSKKNVAAVEMAIEASDEYRMMKDQEALIYSIDEMIRVAKKSSDMNF
jgi:hypothetical protein